MISKVILSAYMLFCVLYCPVAIAQSQYSVIHGFSPSNTNDGWDLEGAALVQGKDGTLYGVAYQGGTQNHGTVYKITPAGTFSVIHNFFDGTVTGDGIGPNGRLTLGPDGNLYGTTNSGGSTYGHGNGNLGYGTVFKITPAGALTIVYNFNTSQAVEDGAYPSGGLLLGKDGNFYGEATDNVGNNQQLIYKLTPAGAFSVMHIFGDGSVKNDGKYPVGLMQASDGNFYGVTSQGGANGYGTLYKMTANGTVTILYSFTVYYLTNQGSYPAGRLVEASDGLLYGITTGGGTHGPGTLYKITKTGTLTILHNFGDPAVANDGYSPEQGLILGSDGYLYGACSASGEFSNGTLYRYGLDGSYAILYSFAGGEPGGAPDAPVIEDVAAHALYGTATEGLNSTQNGAVYKFQLSPLTTKSLSAVGGDTKVTLTWTANPSATSYNLYRSTTAGGEGSTPIVTGLTGTNYIDTAVTNMQTYYYQVTAVNPQGESGPSPEAHATPHVLPTAHFLKVDTATLGNWKDNYGSEGYNVIGDTSAGNPHYRPGFTVTPSTHNSGLWSASTLSSSALQSTTAGSPVRVAGVWSQTSWMVNVNVTGTHQLALYLLDYTNAGYAETIKLTDAVSGALLDTRTAMNFQTGAYYVWNVSGSVNITLTSTSSIGHWAVLSGIFFGGPSGSKSPTAPTNLQASTVTNGISLTWTPSTGASSYNVYRGTNAGGESPTPIATGLKTTAYTNTGLTPNTTYYYKVVAVNAYAGSFASNEASAAGPAPTSSATFVKTDTSTQGNWKGNYGLDGYNVIGDTSGTNPVYPSYATVTPGTHTAGIWAASTSNVAALQKVANGSTDRIAGTWFNTTWSMNVNVTGGSHQLALYFLDYPNAGYAETITIKDAATGYVLDTRSISAFQGGKYEVWNVSGNVTVTLTSTAGHWAPVSGIFFG